MNFNQMVEWYIFTLLNKMLFMYPKNIKYTLYYLQDCVDQLYKEAKGTMVWTRWQARSLYALFILCGCFPQNPFGFLYILIHYVLSERLQTELVVYWNSNYESLFCHSCQYYLIRLVGNLKLETSWALQHLFAFFLFCKLFCRQLFVLLFEVT